MLLLSLMLPSALAQDTAENVNVQWFRPSIDSQRFYRLTDSAINGDQAMFWRGTFSFTQRPLEYVDFFGESEAVVNNLVQLDLAGGYAVGDLRIGADIPILLRTFGGSVTDSTGLGDISVDAKYRIMDRASAPVGLAGTVRLILPSGTLESPLGGGFAVEPEVAVDRAFGDLVLGANVSALIQKPQELEGGDIWGTQGRLGLGGSYLISDSAVAMVELLGVANLADIGEAATRPAELLVGGDFVVQDRLDVRPAVVVGLGDAIGTPRYRFALAVSSHIDQGPKDLDGDGMIEADACPTSPEDVDSFNDADGCPEPTQVRVVVVDSDGQAVTDGTWTVGDKSAAPGGMVELEAGSYSFAYGPTAVASTIPAGPPTEVKLTVPAPRGRLEVKMVDKDGKPVEGGQWSATGPQGPTAERPPGTVSVRPGSYSLVGNAPGYKKATTTAVVERDGTATLVMTMEPSKVELKADRIEIRESVYFETGKATIKQESFAMLDEIAQILREHPEITLLRIEGHTDSRGSPTANKKLSQARAAAVRDYLIGKGVAAERLESAGYGEERPLVKGENETAWSKNRRVDFFIVGRSDQKPAEPKPEEKKPEGGK